MTELIVIKTAEKYFRCKEGRYLLCSLARASVFPMKELHHVQSIMAEIKAAGYPDVYLNRLVITETPFSIEEERQFPCACNLPA